MSAPQFLLDEHVWAALTDQEDQIGTSIVGVQDVAEKGIPDDQVLALATTEKRTLLTANARDFAPLAAEWFLAERDHWGIVIVPGQTQHNLLINGLTNIVASETVESLKNTFRFIQEFIIDSD